MAYIKKQLEYAKNRIKHWNKIAEQSKIKSHFSKAYHDRLKEIYKLLVPKNSRVLEIGCGDGELLASLEPGFGVGIDFSSKFIELAKNKYPNLHFIEADAHNFELNEQFDFIVLSDVINDLFDVQKVFENLKQNCTKETRIIINFYSHLWEIPILIAQSLDLANKTLPQNWLTKEDLLNILNLAGFEGIKHFTEILLPSSVPLINPFFNKFLVKLWPFNYLALTNFLIARLSVVPENHKSVSIIVPARNEEGNIEQIIQRIPQIGSKTEIIFVEGNSKDKTWEKIQEVATKYDNKDIKYYKQTGKGKGDAVRLGFEKANGEVLIILDADMTVPPEDLPRFYDALISNKGEFINGVRLIYPMEKEAMRFLNLLGNKFFSLAFSYLLGQPIKDTLCGTKVLTKENYQKIAANRYYFGEFDPFGDFDLIFGAAKLNLKIIDLPIRYQERTYGETNINRFRDGWLLLKMTLFAARKIKFV